MQTERFSADTFLKGIHYISPTESRMIYSKKMNPDTAPGFIFFMKFLSFCRHLQHPEITSGL